MKTLNDLFEEMLSYKDLIKKPTDVVSVFVSRNKKNSEWYITRKTVSFMAHDCDTKIDEIVFHVCQSTNVAILKSCFNDYKALGVINNVF